jgi:hypothetical protein
MEVSMTEQDWIKFAELLDKIINMPGTWREKQALLQAKAEEHEFEGALDEIAAWFPPSK